MHRIKMTVPASRPAYLRERATIETEAPVHNMRLAKHAPILLLVGTATFGSGLLRAQNTQPDVVDIGYYAPSTSIVTPGQVVTLFVRGMPDLARAAAGSLPLPTSLGGVSVTTRTRIPGFPESLPIFRIEPYRMSDLNCAQALAADCTTVAITVQIPTEGGSCPSNPDCMFRPLELTVRVADRSSKEVSLVVDYRFARVHILRSDDSIVGPAECLQGACAAGYSITHADGTIVSAARPARPGESITFYAVGLGTTTPGVKSGEPAPFPPPRADAVLINSVTYLSRTGDILYLSPIAPDFAGLVTGYVGLYQLNVTLPGKLPDQIAGCGNGWNTQIYGASFCWSN